MTGNELKLSYIISGITRERGGGGLPRVTPSRGSDTGMKV